MRWTLLSRAGAGAAFGGAGVVAGGGCAPIACALAPLGAASCAPRSSSAAAMAMRPLRSVVSLGEVAIMRKLVILILALGCATAAPATLAPAFPVAGGYKGQFNNDDQGHADFCVRLTVPAAALRYPDGSPTGFMLSPEILVPVQSNGVSCPETGMARLDAREIITGADGAPMLFHRGGWGFVGNDPESAVHFGHVRLADIDTAGLRFERDSTSRRWVPAPTRPWSGLGQQRGNGSACSARAATPLTVSVQSIPNDMRYLNSRQSAAIPYAIYGDPSEDLGPATDRDRGVKYTMLTWSWINTRGGGVARALVPDGAQFFPCTDVPSITLTAVSDAERKTPTGWVEARYGAIRSGDGELLYGWIVARHWRTGGEVVRHLRGERSGVNGG